MSGSFTPLPPNPGPVEDLPGIAPVAMPGFQHRKEVQLMLRKWRNSVSLWGQLWNSQPSGARDAAQRFSLPQHTMYIK